MGCNNILCRIDCWAGSKVAAAGWWACGAEPTVQQKGLVSPVALLYFPVSRIEQKVLVTCCLVACSSFPYRAESSCHLLPYSMFQFPIQSRKFLSPVALLYVPVSHTEQKNFLSPVALLYVPVSHIEQKVLVTCYLTLCSSFPSRAESSCHLLPYSMFQFPI